MPLGAVSTLSWCGEVSFGGKHIIDRDTPISLDTHIALGFTRGRCRYSIHIDMYIGLKVLCAPQ